MSLELDAAVGRYCRRFGTTPPMIRYVTAPDYPRLIAAMDQAVASGRRLTLRKVFRIAGVEPVDDPGGEPLPSGPDQGLPGRSAGGAVCGPATGAPRLRASQHNSPRLYASQRHAPQRNVSPGATAQVAEAAP